MRKTACILLLSVFTLNLVGVIGIFKMQQFQVRREIKQQIKNGLAEEELQVIVVRGHDADELSWHNDHEFFWRGSMFDIVKKVRRDDSTVIYYCINDSKEAKLFANLDELVRRQTGGNGAATHSAEKLFKLLAAIRLTENDHSELSVPVHKKPETRYENNYASPVLYIPVPPPKGFVRFFMIGFEQSVPVF
ncbi:MAG TPA: hypothetical protein VF145_12370 [Chitinophagaceae bacterium]